MLNKTLSVITALAITISNLNAESINKNMKIVPKIQKEEVNYTQESSYYSTAQNYDEEFGYQEPYPPAEKIVKPTNNYSDVIIYAKPHKKRYRVHEPIRIQLKLKKSSYVYMWTVGYDGRGYMILPNNFTSYNKFKSYYRYVVPENSSKYEFQSDRVGVEHLYILVTNKPISSTKMKSIFNKEIGGYPTASANATKSFTTKDIHAIAKKENFEYDITHLSINIGNRR